MDGRQIAQGYESVANEPMSDGTLYTSLRRMKENRWVSISKSGLDGRVRVYTVLRDGKKALEEGRRYYRDLSEF